MSAATERMVVGSSRRGGGCSAVTLGDRLQGVLGPIGEHDGRLTRDERLRSRGACAKRVREYATGRYLASLAQRALGLEPRPVSADGRRPVWPEGLVGSISHSDELAIAIVARRTDFRGVGVDLERADRLTPDLYPQLFTEWELATQIGRDAARATLVFSAKESIYKAVNPIVGRWIGFHDVEVALDAVTGTFSARHCGETPENAVLDAGTGYTCAVDRHVVTLYLLPPAPSR